MCSSGDVYFSHDLLFYPTPQLSLLRSIILVVRTTGTLDITLHTGAQSVHLATRQSASNHGSEDRRRYLDILIAVIGAVDWLFRIARRRCRRSSQPRNPVSTAQIR